MVAKSFILLGQPASTAKKLEIDLQNTFEFLQYNVAQSFAISDPSGMLLRLNIEII